MLSRTAMVLWFAASIGLMVVSLGILSHEYGGGGYYNRGHRHRRNRNNDPTNAPTPLPTMAPPTLAPPTLAPPTLAPPTLAPPTLAPPTLAPPTPDPQTASPTPAPSPAPSPPPPTLAPPTLAPQTASPTPAPSPAPSPPPPTLDPQTASPSPAPSPPPTAQISQCVLFDFDNQDQADIRSFNGAEFSYVQDPVPSSGRDGVLRIERTLGGNIGDTPYSGNGIRLKGQNDYLYQIDSSDPSVEIDIYGDFGFEVQVVAELIVNSPNPDNDGIVQTSVDLDPSLGWQTVLLDFYNLPEDINNTLRETFDENANYVELILFFNFGVDPPQENETGEFYYIDEIRHCSTKDSFIPKDGAPTLGPGETFSPTPAPAPVDTSCESPQPLELFDACETGIIPPDIPSDTIAAIGAGGGLQGPSCIQDFNDETQSLDGPYYLNMVSEVPQGETQNTPFLFAIFDNNDHVCLNENGATLTVEARNFGDAPVDLSARLNYGTNLPFAVSTQTIPVPSEGSEPTVVTLTYPISAQNIIDAGTNQAQAFVFEWTTTETTVFVIQSIRVDGCRCDPVIPSTSSMKFIGNSTMTAASAYSILLSN